MKTLLQPSWGCTVVGRGGGHYRELTASHVGDWGWGGGGSLCRAAGCPVRLVLPGTSAQGEGRLGGEPGRGADISPQTASLVSKTRCS